MATHAKGPDLEMAAMVDAWIEEATRGQWRIRAADIRRAAGAASEALGARQLEIVAGRRLQALGWRRVRYMDGARSYWYVSPRLPRADE